MGKQKHGKPDRFGEGGGFSTDATPVDDAVLVAAIQRFIQTFVTKAKRERAQMFLLGRSEKRTAILQQLPEWIEADDVFELEGNAGFPQHLQQRFGSLLGILIDHGGAYRMTIAGASATEDGVVCSSPTLESSCCCFARSGLRSCVFNVELG